MNWSDSENSLWPQMHSTPSKDLCPKVALLLYTTFGLKGRLARQSSGMLSSLLAGAVRRLDLVVEHDAVRMGVVAEHGDETIVGI